VDRELELPARASRGAPIAGSPAGDLHDQRPLLGRRSLWLDLLVYPTHSLPTAASPVLIGLGLAVRHGVLRPWPALLGLLGSWAIHVAGVLMDNHELLRRHPGLGEHPELEAALAEGRLTLRHLRLAAAGSVALALLCAPPLLAIGGWPVLLLGALGLAASLSYAAGPLAYARLGLADPIFLALFGAVAPAATFFIQAASARGPGASGLEGLRTLPAEAWLVGLPVGAAVVAVMLVDDLRDAAFDARKGWRTGTVRFGASFTRLEARLLVGAAALAPLALAASLGPWLLLPLLAAPLAWRLLRAVGADRRADLVPLSPRLAGLALLQGALLAVGLALTPT
jgi:1,4-dihydroxy-2-naphthoate octaprenyltransferase